MNLTVAPSLSRIHSLHCARCRTPYSPFELQRVSACCQQPLVSDYDLHYAPRPAEAIDQADSSMWRYGTLLPLLSEANKVTLGEGMTPLLPLPRLGSRYGFGALTLKDEGQNPTGSFKARGLSMAISKAKELGAQGCIIPTAGNAGVAMAAYCARGGLTATVVMPRHTPEAFKEECYWYGAQVELVDGLINDCAARVRQLNAGGELLDISTLKEPYRLEAARGATLPCRRRHGSHRHLESLSGNEGDGLASARNRAAAHGSRAGRKLPPALRYILWPPGQLPGVQWPPHIS
jgi:threonine synthase